MGIIQHALYHDGSGPYIDKRKLYGKFQNIWRLNNTLLTNTWVKGFLGEIENYLALTASEKNNPLKGWAAAGPVAEGTSWRGTLVLEKKEDLPREE